MSAEPRLERAIEHRAYGETVSYRLTASVPVGNLDRLLAEVIAARPKARTVLRLATATGDEIVFARDRYGRERPEFRHRDGDPRRPMPFVVKRQAGTWTMTSWYRFRDGSSADELMGQCAQRLAATLPRLDDDPLAFPPREPYCRICGRELTDPISVGVGIGPECGLRYPWLFDRRPPEERLTLECHANG